MSDFCLHQYVIRSSVIPVVISGGKVIGMTPAMCELENTYWLCQHNTGLRKHNAAPSTLPLGRWPRWPWEPDLGSFIHCQSQHESTWRTPL